MALCTQVLQKLSKQSVSSCWWSNTIWNACWFGVFQDSYVELPYFWLSMLRLRSPASVWKWSGTKMDGSLVLAWAFMLVAHPHTLLTLHLSLIQGLATSHLNYTLSLMMILPRCHIFALARSHRIGRTLYVPVPWFRCILKSKLEPGNQFQT